MSSREFSEWVAYDNVEPFGDRRWDVRWADLLSFLYNLAQSFVKPAQRKPLEPSEFMPDFWKCDDDSTDNGDDSDETPARPWPDMLAVIEMWNAALGGNDLRPGGSPHDNPGDPAGTANG
ncbi:MAG: DUF4035 domain-containing protein [Planctomycetaceae bacterium]|nr:MAG: DUF4035 domain-containing protein [Planctomycetaceae bacterium]